MIISIPYQRSIAVFRKKDESSPSRIVVYENKKEFDKGRKRENKKGWEVVSVKEEQTQRPFWKKWMLGFTRFGLNRYFPPSPIYHVTYEKRK